MKDEIIGMPKLIGTEQIPFDIVRIYKQDFVNTPQLEPKMKLADAKKIVAKIMESITCKK